jgi:ATP-dependent Lon protease
MPIGGLKEKLLAAHRGGIKTVIVPKENRKDLREIPRRVLRALRIVLVDHMDDVLREALVLEKPEEYFGARRLELEYRAGELWQGGRPGTEPPPILPVGVPAQQPGA